MMKLGPIAKSSTPRFLKHSVAYFLTDVLRDGSQARSMRPI